MKKSKYSVKRDHLITSEWTIGYPVAIPSNNNMKLRSSFLDLSYIGICSYKEGGEIKKLSDVPTDLKKQKHLLLL